MKPEFEHSVSGGSKAIGQLIIGVVLLVVSQTLGTWSTSILVAILKIAGVLIAVGFIVRAPGINVKAYKEKLVVKLGALRVKKLNIDKEFILKIEGLPHGAANYFGSKKSKAEIGQIPGWSIHIKDNTDPCIAIRTQKVNFLLSHSEPRKAEEKLLNVYGITPPSYMKVDDTGYEAVENPWER
ncbi:MAG TPA: hypothetical protein VGB30_05290 [bacterium]|jgi:hypothetical protein